MTAGLVRSGVGECHPCEFPEVQIGTGDTSSPLLPPKTRVLLPCKGCGTTARDAMEGTEQALLDNEGAFGRFVTANWRLMFHWSPAARRKQITRYGLRPAMRPSTHVGDGSQAWRAPYTCLADTPSWAWALSGGQPSAPAGEWDLWQVYSTAIQEPLVMPANWSNGIHEVRTHHRIYKRDIWHVATRTKGDRL